MVLAHNFAFVPVIVAGITICFGSGIEVIGTLSAGIAICGAFIGFTWGKKNREPVTCTPTFGYGNDTVPLFNYADVDQKHPHGIYIDSPNHTSSKRGNISPKPKNGQAALDNSVQVKGASHRRIGISEGEFVILNRTSKRVYHGHVESWEEFGKKLQKFLQKIGWVSSKGKIKYTFQLSELESIIFMLEENTMDFINYDTFATSYFVQGKIKTLLALDTLYEWCCCLSGLLHKIFEKEFIFEEKNNIDIGFLSNEIEYKELILEKKLTQKEEKIAYCTLNYSWLSPVIKRGNIETWLYKDNLGNIIFFMAPVYPFFFSSKNAKNFKAYSEWIKTYKIVAKYIIEQNISKQWLEKAKAIMTIIENNSVPVLRTNGSV
jgi:hypothetical protein